MNRQSRRRARREIETLSFLPGRLSLRYTAVRNRRALAAGIEAELGGMHGIWGATASPLTARVLVLFDPTIADRHGIEAAILAATPLSADDVAEVVVAATNQLRGDRHRLIVGGSALGLLLLKRVLLGAGAFSGNPLLLLVSACTAIVSGYPFLRNGFRSLAGRRGFDADTLITTATITSLLLRESVTALIVLWLLNLGELLQALTLRRVHRAIEDLLTVGDEQVWLVTGKEEVRVAGISIQAGDVVAVYMGERIPVDGEIVTGSASVNEAPITGESIPSFKNEGDAVFAGTVVEAGSLRVRATRVGRDTAVGLLIQRIDEARELRAPVETVAEGFSRRFVPFSFALSIAILLLTREVRRAMTMLVIACPCAAGLSTPTAVSAAIGNAARRGVLIKGGVHLETAGTVDTVIFDKTGTLTAGRARVAHVLSFDPEQPPFEVLRIAASGELHSHHPLAVAVVRYTRELEIEIPEHEECEVIVGRGMRADMGGNRVLVGSERLLQEYEVPLTGTAPAELARYRAQGETVLCVAVNGQLIGLVGVRDVVRPEARQAIASLRRAGIQRLILLTGDSYESAEIVARELGLTEFWGEALPEQKFELVERLQAEGRHVALVGDGINDGPALAAANLGIAMGTSGSDVAVEAADVALARDDVRDVAMVIDLSRRTLGVVKQNYGLSFGVNAVGLLVGATGALNPIAAALLHNLSTVAVVLNSSRLIAYRPLQANGPTAAEDVSVPENGAPAMRSLEQIE